MTRGFPHDEARPKTNKLTSLTFALALGTLAQGVFGIALAQQALTERKVHDRLT